MAFRDEQGGQGGFQPKEEHRGNWTCGTCNGAITKLPFKPREQKPGQPNTLKCLDCYKKSRPQRDNRF